jgi:phosphatidylglycerol---prolipoprotein diacylglyceryl transferase
VGKQSSADCWEAVQLMKRYIGMGLPTGDLYAVPLTLGIAIGRVGCFLTGIDDNTYGTPTRLPWGVDFGDGTTRHPTQLYEIVFQLLLLPILLAALRRVSQFSGDYRRVFAPGDVFNLFMVMYLSFRFVCDFLKPYPRILFGLGGIQWACLLFLLYYASDVSRWVRAGLASKKPSYA